VVAAVEVVLMMVLLVLMVVLMVVLMIIGFNASMFKRERIALQLCASEAAYFGRKAITIGPKKRSVLLVVLYVVHPRRHPEPV
jgi:hypothetical protein